MNTTRARVLRNGMTEPEVILWSRLKRLRAQGCHFRRQAPCGGYILDFVCFDRKLAIELDGAGHDEPGQMSDDQRRDEVLERRGFTVLRFRNEAVRFGLGGVMDVILGALQDSRSRREARVEG